MGSTKCAILKNRPVFRVGKPFSQNIFTIKQSKRK